MRWCEYLVKRRATAWAERSPERATLTPPNGSRRPFYSMSGFPSHYTLSSYVHFAFLPVLSLLCIHSSSLYEVPECFTKCILESLASRSNLLNQDLDSIRVVQVVLVCFFVLDLMLVWDEGDHLPVSTAFWTLVQAIVCSSGPGVSLVHAWSAVGLIL